MNRITISIICICFLWISACQNRNQEIRESVLSPEDFRHYIDTFNNNDNELYKQYIPNDSSWEFLAKNIAFFDCPDKTIERIYYFRWWTYRKHIRQTPEGFVITEFLPDVSWSGKYNTISCPAGHHIYEGRWLRNPEFLKSYCHFWTTPEADPRRYSFWIADAMCALYKVHPDQQFVSEVFPSLESIFNEWKQSNKGANGLYWQKDDRDGMEFSIGSVDGRNYKAFYNDTVRNLYHSYYINDSDYTKQYRPTINSYMFADAKALACFANILEQPEKSEHYKLMAESIQKNTMEKLWDKEDGFFKVLHNDTSKGLVKVKEEVGFVPWAFSLPGEGYEEAWKYLMDSSVFLSGYGITTADMQDPLFMYPVKHDCLWNGYVWPFASSQTLKGMANLLKDYSQDVITKSDYVQLLHQFAASHFEIESSGRKIDWIDESQNPFTGAWHTRDQLLRKGDRSERGKDYNHSSYVDLVITGLCGVTPQIDNSLDINPLITEDWEYFCLDNLGYKNHDICIIWDKTGKRYNKGRGLLVFVDRKLAKKSNAIEKISIEFP